MTGFTLRLLVNALGFWLAAQIVPGMQIQGAGTFVAAVLLLGVVNALVRPVAVLLTLPFTVATLGLFLLVVNAGMFALVAWLLQDFQLAGFGSALMGSIVVSLTGWIGSWYIGPRGSVQVLMVKREHRR
jgi:putative membrane protein